jgi:hypothetical protein
MLIHSYGAISYTVWFVKMKDCMASFEEAKIFPCKLGLKSFSWQDSLFSTLDIQTGISWAYDTKIKQFKSPNSSAHTGLKLPWRVQTSKWDKIVLKNRIATKLGWKPSCGRILCFHARYSKGNILSFYYRNETIQKLKFIYIYRGLQLLWRIQSEIKLFWITESDRNLFGQKDLLIWFGNWLRVWHKNSEQHNCDGTKISF